MNFSPTQMRAAAEKVYPDKPWRLGNNSVFYEAPGAYDMDEVYFQPSLTGSDWQQAQALQCIVAATKIGYRAEFTINTESVSLVIWRDEVGCVETTVLTMVGRDTLTASIAALLASTPSAAENV